MRGKKTGGGSRKGIPNKATAELKDMIRLALDRAGGIDYLQNQAVENPTAFLSLLSKTLPRDMTVNGGENPLVTEIKISYVNARDTDTKGI